MLKALKYWHGLFEVLRGQDMKGMKRERSRNKGRKDVVWVLATLVLIFSLLGSIIFPSQALSSTFQWPVDNPTITQGYAVYNTSTTYPYHTGFDLTSSLTGDLKYVVRAAASGTVRTVPQGTYAGNYDNHNMGNVVIIDHNNGKGPFTLYAHLASITVSNGQFVSQGTQVGVMGNTGTGYPPGTGIHLHFEVKHWNVLGNTDDHGLYWGYTPGNPNLYGYINPWPYLDYNLSAIPTTAVTSSSNQIVRTGPDPTQYTTSVATVNTGQKFGAFTQYNSWYQIYLPSINGPATGWIQGTTDSSATLLEVNDPARGTIGVSVRQTASSSANLLSYVWDNQWLVKSNQASSGNGCSNAWYEIYLASNTGATLGWVCGDYLNVISSETLSVSLTANPQTGMPL